MDPFVKKRSIDIVACLDATIGMEHCIDSFKEVIRRLPLTIKDALYDSEDFKSLRIKIIAFRDYKDGPDAAMVESRFFDFPDEQTVLEDFLSGINAYGGGDNLANGVEALYYAMRSDFVTDPNDRQIIMLFSNSDALPLGERSSVPGYPLDMVDENGLVDLWFSGIGSKDPSIKLREKTKRLVMFAPSGTKYEELMSKLNRSVFCPVDSQKEWEATEIEKMIRSLFALPLMPPI